ncbi:ABC transporter ATP-binding protein [Ornithinibacillus xuwenensis]|uniref:Energy-coupling factor transporter ATPase n=1 Tax=Ornithinibacillus xuwenensis TaxID=3144668 RepID=A0ABU9XGL6_9BACI
MSIQQLNKSLLQVENYSFSYESLNDNQVLQDLSFSLYHNEMSMLIGASGSGKSSLALCLNGLYPEAVEGNSTGNIYFKDKHISDYATGELQQHIGIVFQDPESQFCMITVEDELAFTLENLNIPSSEMPKRILEVLHLVGMTNNKHKRLHELSGGEKQKIALAAVLLLDPNLIIFDEPTANLDPVSRIEFIDLIREIKEEKKLSILIIDHQIDDWLFIVDRLLVLNKNGQIIANDKPDKIFPEKIPRLKQEGVWLPKPYLNPLTVKADSRPTNKPVLLSIGNLSFRRKKSTILSDITLNIPEGEFVTIVGENGAGKSTLLQLMAGLITPDRGTISFQGKEIENWNEKELRANIGFVFQNPEHQFITDTVYDELTFGMKLNGYHQAEIKARTTALLSQFGLLRHKYHNPFSLSGGQKRRVSVATMLSESPKLLLLDEPTFGQDADTTHELIKTLVMLRDNGTTIIIITHDMELADLSDTILVLQNHKVAFSGSPSALWRKTDLMKRARLRLPYRIRTQNKLGR